MLELALWPLWRAIKSPLKNTLGDKFSLLGSHFKALLATTMGDLILALQEEFWDTDVWRHMAKGQIAKSGDSDFDPLIKVEAFPLSAIAESVRIKECLLKHLRNNVRLDAIRTDAKIADAEWNALLAGYAADIVRLGLPFAIRRMIRLKLPLYLERRILALADAEPTRIAGVAGHHQLVVLYDPPYKNPPSLSRAVKIWNARTNEKYEYTLESYDGFKAA